MTTHRMYWLVRRRLAEQTGTHITARRLRRRLERARDYLASRMARSPWPLTNGATRKAVELLLLRDDLRWAWFRMKELDDYAAARLEGSAAYYASYESPADRRHLRPVCDRIAKLVGHGPIRWGEVAGYVAMVG